MKRIILLVTLAMMLPVSMSQSDGRDALYATHGLGALGFDISGSPDIVIDDWYPIEEWELEVCSKWGGPGESGDYVGEGFGQEQTLALTTVTIQAQRSEYEVNGSPGWIYEVAWYLMIANGEETYKIRLSGEGGARDIYKESAGTEGSANYQAHESHKEYDKAKIAFESGTYTVPIIEK